MSISIVNGYVCASCADVSKAKRGENPAKPANAADASPTRLASSLSKAGDASAGGVSAAGTTRPVPSNPSVGRLLDVSV